MSISQPAPPLSDIDLVVGFGGDGTLLHVSSTFASGACPPVLGFSLGTIGFMMPFNIDALETALEDTLASRGNVILRMRLSCSVVGKGEGALAVGTDHQALNEVHIHRGRHPHLTRIDTIVNGRRLTEAVGDGLLVSTPTGSTAYSLSAGGPIVHPSVPGMLLTPICPRSLAFRSVVLPSDAQIELRVQPSSRSSVEVSLDGREGTPLEPGQALRVGMSEYPVPSLVPAGEDTFLADLDLLAWNATFTRRRCVEHDAPVTN